MYRGGAQNWRNNERAASEKQFLPIFELAPVLVRLNQVPKANVAHSIRLQFGGLNKKS
jgi:hypothetical protein